MKLFTSFVNKMQNVFCEIENWRNLKKSNIDFFYENAL